MPNDDNRIETLVSKYNALTQKERRTYNEANTANVFIRPLFEAIDWDFSNINEIVAEQTIVKGRVDYLLKVDNISRLCLEVKALRHELNDDDRRQAISYAYNKGVTWAVLTNFDKLEILNADTKTRDLTVARFISFTSANYTAHLNNLLLLSKQSLKENGLDNLAIDFGKHPRRIPVHKQLYADMTKWRTALYNDVYLYNKENGITRDQADKLVEKLISRFIFIRTAEDRGLAGNHPLKTALHQWETSNKSLLKAVRNIFHDFANTFDSDLFPIDDPWQTIGISEKTLEDVIKDLYTVPNDYAEYQFDVIEPDVLGQVYEQYLGHVANPTPQIQASFLDTPYEFTQKQAKRKKGGIYYTPKWVTDYIVRNTINRYIEEKGDSSIINMRVVDPACGSGSFLIRAYDELLTQYARAAGKSLRDLSWPDRVAILTRNIFGVDLDAQAVEIARLNLLIRALAQQEMLPPLMANIQCGNSLIFGTDAQLTASLGNDYAKLNPFNWKDHFASILNAGGFDIIIGNPPYIMELRKNKDIFRVLKNTPLGAKYYEPKMDIFYFFIEL